MFSIKRIELVIEAVEKSNVINTLNKINITSYTIYKHVGGSGERGSRDEIALARSLRMSPL